MYPMERFGLFSNVWKINRSQIVANTHLIIDRNNQ